MIVEEEEETVATDAAPANSSELARANSEAIPDDVAITQAGDEHDDDEAIEVSTKTTQSRHVHFGSDDNLADKNTATHKTPHINKMAIKRRATVSPSAGSIKRYKTVTHRTSLPATLSQEDGESTRFVQENHYVPLRDALNERMKRHRNGHLLGEHHASGVLKKRDHSADEELEQLRIDTAAKEERIRELAIELEQGRGLDHGDMTADEHASLRAVEAELIALRKEVVANRALGFFDEFPDENMMVIDSQQEVSYPQLSKEHDAPETPTASFRRSTTDRRSQALIVNGN